MAQVEGVAVETNPAAQWAVPALRIVVGIATAALAGVLATLAFPSYELWPLIFVAFVPLAIAYFPNAAYLSAPPQTTSAQPV